MPDDHLGQVMAEVGQYGGDAAELNHGGERHAGVPPTQENGHHLEVGRAADRQELSQALHHPQHEGMPGRFPQ